MCGIAGFAGNVVPPPVADERVRAMCAAIVHRGPDEDGFFVKPGVALGMRRLSIIDIAGGTQPIRNEDGTVTVVFNGEIYNHHHLRQSLVARGHRFVTRSDTETLVHLYEERGLEMVRDLEGMFGFAIWDDARQRLLVARDHLGIKPLYYWDSGAGVAVASELRSLLALPEFPRELSPAAVGAFLSLGYVPEPHAIFAAARKLPPAHTLTWTREEGVRVHRYWTPVRDEVGIRDEREAIEELRRLLDHSVRSHLESEVPLGAFLSGGIDSSTVVAHMAKMVDRRVQTFSIGFSDPRFNEAPHASQVAADIGTDHTELILDPDIDALVEETVCVFDEPFADPSIIPMFLVSQLARERVTVALSGDGGDELFGGYSRYLEVLSGRRNAPAPIRRVVRGVAKRLPHVTPYRNRLSDLVGTDRERFATTVAMALAPEWGGVANANVAALVESPVSLLNAHFDEAKGRDFATQMMMVDLLSYLPGDILTKVDRTTMAVSLEARVPLLNPRLAEFAGALPSSLKVRDGTGKWLLKKAISGIVPERVLSYPKLGFGVPFDAWFRGALKGRVEAIQAPDSPIQAFVDPRAVQRIASEHLVRRRDHSGQIWRLLVLDVWLRGFSRGAIDRPNRPSNQLRDATAKAIRR